ncbi:MAG: hypothetical protein FH758_03770 [Firmicutes bacterium]|nr:hypothetical protein [Bacillota bacterium]
MPEIFSKAVVLNIKMKDQFKFSFEKVHDITVSEETVDSKTEAILEKLGYKPQQIRQQRTGISQIDRNVPSKGTGGGTGELDFALIENDTLKLIIENKEPQKDVNVALEEAIYYANGLRRKGIDVRVVMGFNGLKSKLRVLNEDSQELWEPLLIDGQEVKDFPNKYVIQAIYDNPNKTKFIFKDRKAQDIKSIIAQLREYYRRIKHIQNNNKKEIDFTIAFIALKFILEKDFDTEQTLTTSWKELKTITNYYKLKDDITSITKNVINITDPRTEQKKYEDIFIIKDGQNTVFNFIDIINDFDESNIFKLKQVFDEVSKLEELHSSKIDLFGEIYEELADKKTKASYGQFFTRRHIIRPLVELFFENDLASIVSETKKICDCACGTGGFLTETLKLIEDYVDEKNIENFGVRTFSENTFYGYDIYNSNVVRTKINMYLAGDGFSRIKNLDTLISNEHDEDLDYIVTNVPYGKGDIFVDSEVTKNKRLEVNFLIKIVKMLKPGTGRALVIIPDGLLEAPSLSEVRHWFLKNCELEKIISLPKFSFAPYTKEKTYAIFFKRRHNVYPDIELCKNERFWAYIVDNDGQANSDKKFNTDLKDENGKWYHNELLPWKDNDGRGHPSLIKERWYKKVPESNEKYYNEWFEEIEGKKFGFIDMNEVLQDEVVRPSTISKIKVKQKINKKIELEFPLYPSDLFDEKNNLKQEYIEMLAALSMKYDNTNNTFIDLSKTVYKYLKFADLRRMFSLTQQRMKDLINEEGNLIDDLMNIIKENNDIDYRIKKGNVKFWLKSQITHKVIENEKLLKEINKELASLYFIKSIDEILEEEENDVKVIKEQYEEIINDLDLYYDPFEDRFYDKKVTNTIKLLFLIPERYFRSEAKEPLKLPELKQTTKSIITELENLLKEINIGDSSEG